LRYERRQEEERILVLLNLSHESAQVSHPPGRLLLSTHLDRAGEESSQGTWLRADEGIIVQVRPQLK
jgi:hypothetical protein